MAQRHLVLGCVRIEIYKDGPWPAPTEDIAAGDFTGDGIANVAAIYSNGLWYIDGASLDWNKVPGSAPDSLTAGDVTGN